MSKEIITKFLEKKFEKVPRFLVFFSKLTIFPFFLMKKIDKTKDNFYSGLDEKLADKQL